MNNKIGYIFNKYEIAYIAEMMGTSYIINIGINFDEKPEEIAAKAKKSLIEKNYVFRDFNGEFVLNKEFITYFKALVSPEGFIACRKSKRDLECNFLFFTKNNAWLCVENDISNNDNYILTYSDDYTSVAETLKEISDMGLDNKEKFSRFKFVMNETQYRIIKDMLRKNDRDGLVSMLSMIDVKQDYELISEIEKICSENHDIFSIVFFGDYKHNPANMKCLLCYPTDKYVWKVDAGDNGSMRISCVSQDDISRYIYSMLKSEFGICTEKRSDLFQ